MYRFPCEEFVKMNRKINSGILISLFFGLLWIGGCFSIGFNGLLDYERCDDVGKERICHFRGSTETHDWISAKTICQNQSATLPIVRSIYEQGNFEYYLRILQFSQKAVQSVWTSGKTQRLPEWTWINGQRMRNQTIRNERDNRPHAQLLSDFTYKAENSSIPSWYICQYKELSGLCTGIGSVKLSNSCIVLSKTGDRSWFEARNDCLLRKGDLAVLTDDDLEMLNNHISRMTRNMEGDICQYRERNKNCSWPYCFKLTNRSVVLDNTDAYSIESSIVCSLNGGMFTPLTGHDLQMIANESKQFSHQTYWIGLGKASWLWMLDGESTEDMKYTAWDKTAQYGEECISVDSYSHNWKWHPVACRASKSVVCQRRVQKTVATTVVSRNTATTAISTRASATSRRSTVSSTAPSSVTSVAENQVSDTKKTCDCMSYATFSSLAVVALFLCIGSNVAFFVILKRRAEKLPQRQYEEISRQQSNTDASDQHAILEQPPRSSDQHAILEQPPRSSDQHAILEQPPRYEDIVIFR